MRLQLTSLELHGQGAFDLEGKFPPVPANVKLWKGLFSDSLPGFIKEMDAKDPKGKFMINYLHVDCDLYVGALSVEQARRRVCLWRSATCAKTFCTLCACHVASTYAGARDVFTMLEDRILPGALVVFDEVGRSRPGG